MKLKLLSLAASVSVAALTSAQAQILTGKVSSAQEPTMEGVLVSLKKEGSTIATTVVTNALLENKGARAGFVATRGMRDLLELRRSSRADLYDLLQDAPAVLVPRRWRFEITERIDAQGEVVTPLAEGELPGLIEAIRA